VNRVGWHWFCYLNAANEEEITIKGQAGKATLAA